MGVECIIFDAMGVIFPISDDVNDLLVPFIRAHHSEVTSADIHDLYFAASLGRISSETFWNSCRISGIGPKELEYSYLGSCLEPDAAFFPVAETLIKKNFRLAMLSNDVSEWSAFLRRKWGLDDIFEVSVISGDVGIRKPDRQIYRYAMGKLMCAPEKCVFIDDRTKNLLPARALGLQVIRFEREKAAGTDAESIQKITYFDDLLDVL